MKRFLNSPVLKSEFEKIENLVKLLGRFSFLSVIPRIVPDVA